MNAEQKIKNAIQKAKNVNVFALDLKERREILNKIAEEFKIQGLLIVNSQQSLITGWTSRVRVTV